MAQTATFAKRSTARHSTHLRWRCLQLPGLNQLCSFQAYGKGQGKGSRDRKADWQTRWEVLGKKAEYGQRPAHNSKSIQMCRHVPPSRERLRVLLLVHCCGESAPALPIRSLHRGGRLSGRSPSALSPLHQNSKLLRLSAVLSLQRPCRMHQPAVRVVGAQLAHVTPATPRMVAAKPRLRLLPIGSSSRTYRSKVIWMGTVSPST